MRGFLAFLFHLTVAMLCTPMLAMMGSIALVYRVLRFLTITHGTAQQFYSDHLFVIVFTTGLVLAYVVCETLAPNGAVWVWIPAVVAVGIRMAMWQASGSVLYHSNVVEHFFTSNCQIQEWHDANFGARCGDKLFTMQIALSGLGYSAGAIILRIKTALLNPTRVSC